MSAREHDSEECEWCAANRKGLLMPERVSRALIETLRDVVVLRSGEPVGEA